MRRGWNDGGATSNTTSLTSSAELGSSAGADTTFTMTDNSSFETTYNLNIGALGNATVVLGEQRSQG